MNILLIGNGAREHAIAEAIIKNSRIKLFSYMKSKNPGIAGLSTNIQIGSYDNLEEIKNFAKINNIDFAFIGPEDPLNNGVVDALNKININCIGPTKNLAKLETSKSFTRLLLKKYKINGNPKFKVFNKDNFNEIKKFLNEIESVVVKPDGLTAGKGVKVQGDHFQKKEEALAYCKEVLKSHPAVVVEEKLEGEEFSLQCFTDGKNVVAMPPVQDHKRAYENDFGPNTGGMGSYSCENHLLPFLKKEHIKEALKITQQVADAIYKETNAYYKGVMYGGFILTKQGIKLLEYNARLGDPEAMNVLPLMETDFVEVCGAILNQKLNKIKIKFQNKATVCKYVVPAGYPENPVKNQKITINKDKIPEKAKIYYASVDEKNNELFMTSSRAVAFLGIGDNLEEAEKIAEQAVKSVRGPVFHRKDIGTKALIEKRVRHMESLRK